MFNLSQSTSSNIKQWIITLLIVFIIFVLVLMLTVKDDSKANKARRNSKNKQMNIDPIDLQKASEEALSKATDQMISKYKVQFDSQLKMNMLQLDQTFRNSLESITKEFKESLDDFRVKSQKIAEETQSKMLSVSEAVDKSTQAAIDLKKSQMVEKVENRINNILVSYLNNSLEGTIDLNDQEDYIFEKLEQNKSAILEDIKNVRI